MVTHHVSLRGACPAPLGVDSIAGRVLPQNEPDSSGAHSIQAALLLLPTGTAYRGTPKQYWDWEGANCPNNHAHIQARNRLIRHITYLGPQDPYHRRERAYPLCP